ncbi:helix-turn-helix domain-containing protein [Streptomyces qaidamensis]|uniref:helix-turn-helix domain-containing protein n=1 Tax=Streptomyces qaidamensis TaxID=1783515 RepID=UPI00364740CD
MRQDQQQTARGRQGPASGDGLPCRGHLTSRSVQEQRLERAARLLTGPRHARRTITDIAFGLGFKDASHFTRAFKNHYRTGPRDYRDQHSPSGPA